MTSPLPPDPYAALGVPESADSATIKSTYRKLVLKCHPDKVTDESLKKQKQEEFHKIQQAYEIIGDEEKRAMHDAAVRLAQLRREKLEKSGGGPRVEVRTASYDIRTAVPSGAAYGSHGPPRFDERRPSRSYDDDKYFDDRSSSRKYDGYEAYPKRSSPRTPRTEKEPVKAAPKTNDRTRSEQRKTRERDERRGRREKFSFVDDDDSSDGKARYEAAYRRRDEDARRFAEEEGVRKAAAEARRKAEEIRRAAEESTSRPARRSEDREDYFVDDRTRKLNETQGNAKDYIQRARASADADPRPSTTRTTSSKEARPDHYEVRSRRDRSEAVRRSSARPRERETSRPVSSGRDSHRERKHSSFPEIVEWDNERERKPPSFKQSFSSPADIKTVPRVTPQRSHTESTAYDHRRTETSPTPMFRRSETMPSVHTTPAATATRRKESIPARSSTLRNSETVLPNDSGYSSPGTPETAFPSVPPCQPTTSTKTYYYGTPGGGVSLAPEDIGLIGHRTVLREPGRRARSPSPLHNFERPPFSASRTIPIPASVSRPSAPPRANTLRVPPPPLGRSATISHSPERRPSLDIKERGRSRELFGEIPKRQQTSFNPESVSWGPKIGREDIIYGNRGRERVAAERERDYTRPQLRRGETFAY